jgi:hypothetical protein
MLREPAIQDGKLEAMLRSHRAEILRGLRHTPGFQVLIVDYPELVLAPEKWAGRLESFLAMPLPLEVMRAAIKPELYRNRA